MIREVCAFGGKIFIGVTDGGLINGVEFNNETRSRLQDSINSIEPQLAVSFEYHDSVIIITIPESKDKPHSCKDGFFLRIGPNSQKLTRKQIIEFFQKEGLIHFDELINSKAVYPEHFSVFKYDKFIELAKISSKLRTIDILQNLSCIRNNQLTNAGVLFFGVANEFMLLQAKISAILFQGTKNVTILDRKDFCDDLVSNIEDSMVFLRKHLNLSYKIKHLQREEILEIPEVALREALVNAACHRDYFEKGANISISIFSDRVEISNPGGLPSGLPIELFGRKSVTRNSVIADLLHRIGYIEKIGTGIQRIKDAVADVASCTVEFEISENWFTTIFYRKHDNVTDRLSQIVRIMKDNPNVSSAKLAELLQVSKRTILRDIEKLKHDKISRIGTERDGYWQIIIEQENTK